MSSTKKITKALNSALNSLTSGLQPGRKTTQNQRRRGLGRRYRSRFRRPRTVNNSGLALPAAYTAHVRPRFNMYSRGENVVRVSGCDLVYPIPNTVQAGNLNLFALIPSNPAYWTGTKIAQLAPAFANFRPLAITFSYIPQVAVTQPGTVYMGTLWNNAVPSENTQQSLYTSNGGATCQCYIPCDTTITLGSNLQQNLFTMNGAISPDTSPFIFLAGVAGADVIPGYFVVSYTFEFKNPLGQSWHFGRTAISSLSSLLALERHMNESLVLLNQSGKFGPGTVLDLEGDSVYYHGSLVELDSSDSVIMFYNDQSAPAVSDSGGQEPPSESNPNLITQFRFGATGPLHSLSELTFTTGGVTGLSGLMLDAAAQLPNLYLVSLGSITIGTDNPGWSPGSWYYATEGDRDSVIFLNAAGDQIFSVFRNPSAAYLNASLFDQSLLPVASAAALSIPRSLRAFPPVQSKTILKARKAVPEAASSKQY